MTLADSNISYTVQIMSIIPRACFFILIKKKQNLNLIFLKNEERNKESTDTVGTNLAIFAEEEISV